MSWYCENCKKSFSPLGMPRHRKMHEQNKEDCVFTVHRMKNGNLFKFTYTYKFSQHIGDNNG
jgi:hypothetical protein